MALLEKLTSNKNNQEGGAQVWSEHKIRDFIRAEVAEVC